MESLKLRRFVMLGILYSELNNKYSNLINVYQTCIASNSCYTFANLREFLYNIVSHKELFSISKVLQSGQTS